MAEERRGWGGGAQRCADLHPRCCTLLRVGQLLVLCLPNQGKRNHGIRNDRVRMEGIYVDGKHCMHIVLRGYAEGAWLVHSSDPQDEGHTCEMDSSLFMKKLDGKTWKTWKGKQKSDGLIVWNTGETWSRIHISRTQQEVIVRRPYVPLTVLFVSGVWSAVKAGYDWIVTQKSGEVETRK